MLDIDDDTNALTITVLAWIESTPDARALCLRCAETVWNQFRESGHKFWEYHADSEIARQIKQGMSAGGFIGFADLHPLPKRLIALALQEVDWFIIAWRCRAMAFGFTVAKLPEDEIDLYAATVEVSDD